MENKTYHISEISVSYNPKIKDQPIITHSEDAYRIFYSCFPEETIQLQERFFVMYLNRSNTVLGIYPVSTGGITGTVADPRLILAVALKGAATAIMLCHNHPSGSLKPSNADIDLTFKIKEAARYLDITILDHIIVSPIRGEYLSFVDEGLL